MQNIALQVLPLVWYFHRLKMQNNREINLINFFFFSVPLLFNLFYMNRWK